MCVVHSETEKNNCCLLFYLKNNEFCKLSLQPLTGEKLMSCEFSDETVGMNIPKNFIPGVEKGFREVCEAGKSQPFTFVCAKPQSFIIRG